MNPLGGHIYLLGAPEIAAALRTYSPWWAKRNYALAVAMVFILEIIALVMLATAFAK